MSAAAARIVAQDSWALMYSGRRVNLSAPRIDTIDAMDIAVHLSRMPMYRGATWGFVGYSIAQHSTIVANEAARAEGPLAALYALLHHAGEAFGILPYGADAFLEVVHGAFDLDWPVPPAIAKAVRHAHNGVEMTERRQLLKVGAVEIKALERLGARPVMGMIKPVKSDEAKRWFRDALRVNAIGAQIPAQAMPAMAEAWDDS